MKGAAINSPFFVWNLIKIIDFSAVCLTTKIMCYTISVISLNNTVINYGRYENSIGQTGKIRQTIRLKLEVNMLYPYKLGVVVIMKNEAPYVKRLQRRRPLTLPTNTLPELP